MAERKYTCGIVQEGVYFRFFGIFLLKIVPVLVYFDILRHEIFFSRPNPNSLKPCHFSPTGEFFSCRICPKIPRISKAARVDYRSAGVGAVGRHLLQFSAIGGLSGLVFSEWLPRGTVNASVGWLGSLLVDNVYDGMYVGLWCGWTCPMCVENA